MKVKKCRICSSRDLSLVFSLGKQPLVNNLLAHPKEKQKVYPLELLQCNHCGLIQLNYIVPKEKMFDNYFYIPSASKMYMKHFDDLSTQLIKELKLKKDDLVVDIGGSDGSLLKTFENKGMKVVNIEPAKNITSSVTKVNKYFDKKTAQYVVRKYGKAKLATATNVFAHIDDIHDFISNLDILLDQDGVFFAQFPDARNLLNQNQFDTIYHEHLSYFMHEPLYHLFNKNSPFEIFKIEDSAIHGGSMRMYIRKRDQLLSKFSDSVSKIKDELQSYLNAEKMKGKKIAGFGAAAKGLTLLYYCELDNNIIDYIADGNTYKQGKFSAGTKIPVVAESEIVTRPPDIILVLAWNFKDEIMEKVKKMLVKNKQPIFVIPIPHVTIVK
jgi:frataxin-like iron-binding protein CyaY